VPDGTGDFSHFGGGTQSHSVSLDVSPTVGTMIFDSSGSYTLSGTHTLTVASGGLPLVTVQSGSHIISAPLHLSGSTTFDIAAGSSLTLSGTVSTASGTVITKQGAGAMVMPSPNTKGLEVNGGVLRVPVNGGNSGAIRLETLNIVEGQEDVVDGAALDLNDNDLVVSYGTNLNPFREIHQWMIEGYRDSADPTAIGIVSSTSQGSSGIALLKLFDNAIAGLTDFDGVTVEATAVIGKYTYFGDLNFDGQVTEDDLSYIDFNLNTTPAPGIAAFSGDANMDGSVNGDDYGFVETNIGLGVGNPLAPASMPVPEPAMMGVGAFVAAAFLRPRRRRIE
jgi:hypothetical protein